MLQQLTLQRQKFWLFFLQVLIPQNSHRQMNLAAHFNESSKTSYEEPSHVAVPYLVLSLCKAFQCNDSW